MKKLFNILLVLVMLLTIVPVNAATTTTKGKFGEVTGTIKINRNSEVSDEGNGSALPGEIYKAYRLVDLQSYDTEKGSYVYVLRTDNTAWNSFLANQEAYVTLNEVTSTDGTTQTYVTWVEDADVAAFAKLAYEYALANNIAADKSVIAPQTGDTVIPDLPLGWYLVNSTVGVVCSLDTTNNEVVINEKNAIPYIDKKITGDFVLDEAGLKATAEIGNKVPYEITLKQIGGKKNVFVTDTLTEGLTFNNDVVVKDGNTVVTDYTVSYNTETNVVTIDFRKDTENTEYTETMEKNGNLVITYTATINEKALTNIPNENTATITYGNGTTVESETPEVTTFGFDLIKIGDNETTNKLAGAEFTLWNKDTNTKVLVEKLEDGTYRVTTDSSKAVNIVTTTTKVTINGLSSKVNYELQEEVAPDGYTKLAARVDVEKINGQTTETYAYSKTTVNNTSGAVLPSTGGMGTVLFITIGSLMVLGFGVLLVTKFRMSKVNA